MVVSPKREPCAFVVTSSFSLPRPPSTFAQLYSFDSISIPSIHISSYDKPASVDQTSTNRSKGLARLAIAAGRSAGGIAIVSHDRALISPSTTGRSIQKIWDEMWGALLEKHIISLIQPAQDRLEGACCCGEKLQPRVSIPISSFVKTRSLHLVSNVADLCRTSCIPRSHTVSSASLSFEHNMRV